MLFRLAFSLHDWLCDILIRQMKPIKWTLLAVAHFSLLGLLFPELNKDFASLALDVLLVLLFLSPASKLFRMRLLALLMGYRREMGILMGYFATVHACAFFLTPGWFDFAAASFAGGAASANARMATGVAAYILTLPLLLTSNAVSQRVLGRNWKRLHLLAYPLLFMALFHKFAFNEWSLAQSWGAVLLSAIIFVGYVLVKVLASNPTILPFVPRVIQWIADRYRKNQKASVL